MFSEWLPAIHTSTDNMKRTGAADRSTRRIDPIPILQMSDNEADTDPSDNGDNVCNMKNLVKIDLEDVQSKVDFWSSSVICYVVGASPTSICNGRFYQKNL